MDKIKYEIELSESELEKLEKITESSFFGDDIDEQVSKAISKLLVR